MILWERQLEDDLDWRWAELASLKLQTLSQKKDSIKCRSMLRALWAMLYAHYEGYCLYALNIYLEQLEKMNVVRAHCKTPLVIFSLEQEFRQLRGNTSGPNCYEFFSSKFRDLLEETLTFERVEKTDEYKLKGESNLYPKDLTENCDALCLTLPSVHTYKTELWALVKRRNGIAHGEKIIINDLKDYQPYEDAASAVMHELAYEVIEAINKEKYKKDYVEYII